MRLHRKVWVWWGPWWALQAYADFSVSLGLHIDLRRGYADLHVLWFTLSVGNNPVVTNERHRERGSCRGFLFRDSPLL